MTSAVLKRAPASTFAFVIAAFCIVPRVSAQDATTPGNVTSPHPTLENLSVEWEITGDDNTNGSVTVRYREMGTTDWREGLPLRRVPAGSNVGFSWSNKHAGSVFNLVPNTTYEIELRLEDPDGGTATETVVATTRPVPEPASDATEVSVTPENLNQTLDAADPGDILVLADGAYDGFSVSRSGTEAQPLVIRSENPGGAVVEGDIRLDGTEFVHLEGLTINGTVRLDDTVRAVVSRCTVQTPGSGIVAFRPGATDAYVCDNVVLGPTTSWTEPTLGASGDNLGEGIELTGPGNVICYNRVEGFRDAISTLEQGNAVDQFSIDIYNNDINLGADDGIEADFTMGNVRVMRNRIRNSWMAISGQPSLGGPSYYIRNVMYNIVAGAFKLNRGSDGDVGLHNTVVKCGDGFGVYAGAPVSRAYFRNNLFIGGEGDDACWGNGSVVSLADADSTSSFDYNGYGSVGTGAFRGRIGDERFNSLAELQSNTTEQNAVAVDLDVFAATVDFPGPNPFPQREHPDLRISDSNSAVDVGIALPNVNDGFVGGAPDLGAYEAGSALPHYGPRGVDMPAVCGDGAREGLEQCDDGNTDAGDGCDGLCRLEGTTTPGTDGGIPDNDGGVTSPGRDGGVAPMGSDSSSVDGGCAVGPASLHHLVTIGLSLGVLGARRRRRR